MLKITLFVLTILFLLLVWQWAVIFIYIDPVVRKDHPNAVSQQGYIMLSMVSTLIVLGILAGGDVGCAGWNTKPVAAAVTAK